MSTRVISESTAGALLAVVRGRELKEWFHGIATTARLDDDGDYMVTLQIHDSDELYRIQRFHAIGDDLREAISKMKTCMERLDHLEAEKKD